MNRRIREIVKKIEGKQLLFPTIQERVHKSNVQRATKIIDYLKDRKNRYQEMCENCGVKQARQSMEAYDTPWDEEPHRWYFCSDNCEQENMFERGEYDFFYCCECDRCICKQNPSHGWHGQYREVDNGMICLKCYEEVILREGIPRYKFENGVIAGMFFSTGNTEALDAGWEEVDTFFIRNQDSIDRYCKKAMDLIDEKYMVINCYESMGLGGGEGTVTMMYKE